MINCILIEEYEYLGGYEAIVLKECFMTTHHKLLQCQFEEVVNG